MLEYGQRNIGYQPQKESVLSSHTATKYKIDFKCTKLLTDTEHKLITGNCMSREAIEMEKRLEAVNKRDDGLSLNRTWKAVISATQTRRKATTKTVTS